jgi:hypothetical protein
MRVIVHIVLWATLAGSAPVAWGQTPERLQVCSGDTEQALAAALQYGLGDVPVGYVAERIDLKSPVVPDYGILINNGQIYVRNIVDDPRCTIDASVRPRSANVAFTIVNEDQIRELAERDGEGIAYVRALEVRFRDSEVGIHLGVALRPASENVRGLTCCCGGEMVLRRVSREWVFVEWRNVFCA